MKDHNLKGRIILPCGRLQQILPLFKNTTHLQAGSGEPSAVGRTGSSAVHAHAEALGAQWRKPLNDERADADNNSQNHDNESDMLQGSMMRGLGR